MKIFTRTLILSLILSLLLCAIGCDLVPAPAGGGFTPTTYTEVVKTSFERTYADQLSPNEKQIYDAVAATTPGESAVSIDLPEQPALCQGREPTDAEVAALEERLTYWAANALYALWLDTPEMFWIDHTHYSYEMRMASDDDGVVKLTELTLHLTVTGTKEEIAAERAALAAAISDFSPLGATVADKVAYINAYLCSRIEYDLEAKNRGNVLGALVDKKCVCEGYARAFAFLCRKAGIEAVNIPGYGKTDEGTEGHMWNGVFIDGTLYGVDVTWNDTTKKNDYLLVGASTVCHDKAFSKTHTPDMLTLEGPHKAFSLPSIAENAYGVNH